MTNVRGLNVNDVVDFKLSPIGKFEKGNYLKGKVVGFTLGRFVKIDSPTYTKRSGLAVACVPVSQIRPHVKTNEARREKEWETKVSKWVSENSKPKNKGSVKKAKKDYSKLLELAQK